MNSWNLYFYGLYLNWIRAVRNDLQKWQVIACPGRMFPVDVIMKGSGN
jgi:hypothetical protein